MKLIAILVVYILSFPAQAKHVCDFIFEHELKDQSFNTFDNVIQMLQLHLKTENDVHASQEPFDEYLFSSRDNVVTRIRHTYQGLEHAPLNVIPNSPMNDEWEVGFHVRTVFNQANITYALFPKILRTTKPTQVGNRILKPSKTPQVGANTAHELAKSFIAMSMIPLKYKGIYIRSNERTYPLLDDPQIKLPTSDRALIVFTLLNIDHVVAKLEESRRTLELEQFFQTLNYELSWINELRKNGPHLPITKNNFSVLAATIIKHILRADAANYNTSNLEVALFEMKQAIQRTGTNN